MIYLFTDFGLDGPYVGQMHAVLAGSAPGVPVIDLMHDAPVHDPKRAAYLLAALAPDFPDGSVCCAVVDPGVGTDRPPVVLEADGHWYVGPGNGLFELIRRRSKTCRAHRIRWAPARLSDSFHGRDLFAPVAGHLAAEARLPDDWLAPYTDALPGANWPDDLAEIIYTDRFGNLMTGIRSAAVDRAAVVGLGGQAIHHARTFGEAPAGTPFWYANSSGLLEIAMPNASAADTLGAEPGSAISVTTPD